MSLKLQIKAYWVSEKTCALLRVKEEGERSEKHHLDGKLLKFPRYFNGFMGTVWLSWKTQEAWGPHL